MELPYIIEELVKYIWIISTFLWYYQVMNTQNKKAMKKTTRKMVPKTQPDNYLVSNPQKPGGPDFFDRYLNLRNFSSSWCEPGSLYHILTQTLLPCTHCISYFKIYEHTPFKHFHRLRQMTESLSTKSLKSFFKYIWT